MGEEDLANQYSKASLFCLASITKESEGNVTHEATAMGLPVICTDIPCRKDAEDQGYFVVPASDSKKLSEMMCLLIGDRNLRAKSASQAQLRLHSYDRLAADFISYSEEGHSL